ncbi:MAG TPA: hypothetical protein VMX54_10145 [Vicinamibacteria bacterium]|nr:hypothetical protein [Vicinamibacteria bacterium]
MATPVPPSTVSPVDALREAFDHARRQLFPLRFEKWLVLGLLAFLDQCGRSFHSAGGPGGHHGPVDMNVPPGIPEGPHGPAGLADWLVRMTSWLSAHAPLVVAVVLGSVLVIAVLAAIVLWFNSRGVFMYLDAVVSGRTDIGRPWRQHAGAAASYYGWSLGLSLAVLFTMLFAGGVVAASAFALATGRLHETGGWLAAAAFTPILLLLLLALPLLALARVALRDFVAPLQLATGLPCGPAARVLEGLVMQQPGAFVLYLLLKLVVVVGTGIVVTVLGCLTCCLGFLPVVMQVVFQPLFFFERSFSVFLLRQLGYDVQARLA